MLPSSERGEVVSSIAFERVDMIWMATDSGIHNPYILGADNVVNGVVASVHVVHYISNYYSLKYMQILAG